MSRNLLGRESRKAKQEVCRACEQLRLLVLGLCTGVPGELVEMLIQDHFSDILGCLGWGPGFSTVCKSPRAVVIQVVP